jgi:hypothetical protein
MRPRATPKPFTFAKRGLREDEQWQVVEKLIAVLSKREETAAAA